MFYLICQLSYSLLRWLHNHVIRAPDYHAFMKENPYFFIKTNGVTTCKNGLQRHSDHRGW